MATREQVYQAVFAKLVGLQGTVSWSRRVTLPTQVPLVDQPALMLWEQPEKTDQSTPKPPNRVWRAEVLVVFTNDDKTVPGATIINPILDAIEAAFAVDDPVRNACTLGGLVHYCRIEGQTYKETGDTDPSGLGGAIVPIAIRVP
jgi:hypothetical protein